MISWSRYSRIRRAIGRVAMLAVIVIIVLIIAGGVFFFVVRTPGTSITSTNTSTNSNTNTSTGTSTATSTTSSAPSTLVIDDSTWPSSDLNIFYAETSTFYPDWLMYDVYQPLVFTNETQLFQTGNIVYKPGLAQNWTVSPNGLTYTFNLVQNVSFSDGNPLNSYQVWAEMYIWYYLSGNASAWLDGYPIFNMSSVDFGSSTLALINQSGLVNPSTAVLNMMKNTTWPIYVTSQDSIVFQLTIPYNQFLGLFPTGLGQIYDVQWGLDHGGFGTPSTYNSYFNQHPIPGTGPYVVSGVSEDSYVQFVQNPNYWGTRLSASQIAAQPLLDPGHVKNAIIYYKPDDVTRYADLSNGNAQIAAVLQSDWNLVLANSAKYSYFILPTWSSLDSALGLNTKIYPTNNTDLRQAIVHALNYTQIADSAFLGQASPYFGPEYPAWKDYYNPGNYSNYQYNLTLARQYLTMSGISNPALSMNIVNEYPFATNLATTVQSDLAQIGITVTITIQSPSVFYTPFGSYSYEVQNAASIGNLVEYFGTWAVDQVTAAANWVTFVSNQSYAGNTAIYYNPIVQNGVNALLTSSNVTYIQQQLRLAEGQIYQDAPYAWLGVMRLWYADGSLVWPKSVVNGFMVDPTMTGWDTAPFINTVTFV